MNIQLPLAQYRKLFQKMFVSTIITGVCVFPSTLFPAEELVHGAAEKAAEQAVEEAAVRAVEKAAEEVVEKATGEVVEKAVEQAVEKAAEKAVEEAAEVAVEKAAEKVMEKAAEEAVEEAVEKVTEEAVEKATGKAVEEAVEKAAEKVVEKAAEEAAEKAELMARRPDEWRGPTKVHFLVFVIDIDNIDDANQTFAGNVYLRLRWKDRRLANPGASTRQIRLEEVWNPRVLLANREGLVSRSLPEVVQVDPDGTVFYHQRYTGKLSQPLNLSRFPMDTHTFTIHFAAAGYSDDVLEFVPDNFRNLAGGSMAEELSLPDWKVVSYEALALPYNPIEEIRGAAFALRFEAQRYVAYYVWQVVLPLTVVVVMSWAAFWIGGQNVGVRIGVATSSILTLIAHRFVLASLLPRLPYMTRMDYFSVGSTLLVFLALITVVLTSFLVMKEREVLSHRIDIWARVTFPAVFLFLLGWFLYW